MNSDASPWFRRLALLAINVMFLMIWGFGGIGKIVDGMPSWFDKKFGATILARVPGLPASFWLLTICEVAAFALALVALARAEFLEKRRPTFLTATLVWSLFVWIQLAFGQWLTSEFVGAFYLTAYFGVTLVALQFVAGNARGRTENLNLES